MMRMMTARAIRTRAFMKTLRQEETHCWRAPAAVADGHRITSEEARARESRSAHDMAIGEDRAAIRRGDQAARRADFRRAMAIPPRAAIDQRAMVAGSGTGDS